MGGARRDCRRHPPQPDAVRLPDPGAEGPALVARGGGARGAVGRARLRGGNGRRHRRARRRPAAIRAAGTEAGWAFQLQDPRTIMLLLLLAVAITANLLGLFELPVLGGARSRRAASAPARSPPSSRRRAPGRSSAPRLGRRCCFRQRARSRCSLRSVSASRCHSCGRLCSRARDRLPKPGRWMDRLKHFLAIPMARARSRHFGCCTGWLASARVVGTLPALALLLLLFVIGFAQRRDGRRHRACWRSALIGDSWSICRPEPPARSTQAANGRRAGAKRASRASRAEASRSSSISPPTGA